MYVLYRTFILSFFLLIISLYIIQLVRNFYKNTICANCCLPLCTSGALVSTTIILPFLLVVSTPELSNSISRFEQKFFYI